MFRLLTIESIEKRDGYKKLISVPYGKIGKRKIQYSYVIPNTNKFSESDIGTRAVWVITDVSKSLVSCVFKQSVLRLEGIDLPQTQHEGMDVSEHMFSLISSIGA